jgi:quercetin dioxygenase-like cupin family protein
MSSTPYQIDWDAVPERIGVSGIPIKCVNGEFMQLSRVELPSGFENQAHSHPSEQFGIVLTGTIEYNIEGTIITCRTGDCYIIAAGKQHSVKVVSDESVHLLECFSPPRKEYQ